MFCWKFSMGVVLALQGSETLQIEELGSLNWKPARCKVGTILCHLCSASHWYLLKAVNLMVSRARSVVALNGHSHSRRSEKLFVWRGHSTVVCTDYYGGGGKSLNFCVCSK